MPDVEAFDDVLRANHDYASRFDAGELGAPPRMKLAVLTCMDARIDTHGALGLVEGDAHVLRNAGARVTDDVVRSLIKSVHQLGVERVLIMHHTDCGAAKVKLDHLREVVTASTGNDPAEVEFHLIADPDAALAEDVAALAESPFLPAGLPIGALRYDVTTGVAEPKLSRRVGD